MDKKQSRPTTIDEYIAQCPAEVQPTLQELRKVIKETAPKATEKISYGMPGFYLNGMLVWFGLHKDFIGFYPTGEGMEVFQKEFSNYKTTKGAAHFPLDQPIPYDLVRKVVRYRVGVTSKKY